MTWRVGGPANSSRAEDADARRLLGAPERNMALSLGCDAPCISDRVSAACRIRVDWATHHRFKGAADASAQAHAMVLIQCPI